jgi:hypothetical protein
MQYTISLVDAVVLEEIVCLFSFLHRRITASVTMFRMDGKEDESLKVLIGWNTRNRWDTRMNYLIGLIAWMRDENEVLHCSDWMREENKALHCSDWMREENEALHCSDWMR